MTVKHQITSLLDFGLKQEAPELIDVAWRHVTVYTIPFGNLEGQWLVRGVDHAVR